MVRRPGFEGLGRTMGATHYPGSGEAATLGEGCARDIFSSAREIAH